MSFPHELGGKLSAVPQSMPVVEIVRSTAKIREVECPEIQWMLFLPQIDAHSIQASYNVETGALDYITEYRGIDSKLIHGIDCVRVQMNDYESGAVSPIHHPDALYCGIRDGSAEIFAIEEDGKLYSFKDKGFERDWGGTCQHGIVDDDSFVEQEDGSFLADKGLVFGAGTWDVTVGSISFTCLRAIEPGSDENEETVEAFIEPEGGRTVLYRQYRGRLMPYQKEQDLLKRFPVERFPDNRRLVINGMVFVQCNCSGAAHEVITETGLGLA